jgi:sugar O-acyltransferase (sialic acid O-acetyltransferase NeuD family)
MNATTTPLLILGTGTFAVETALVAAQAPGFAVAGFVENMDRAKCGTALDGRPVWWVGDLAARVESHRFVCGLGTTHRSRFTAQVEALGGRFATVVHPTAWVTERTVLGPGTIVHPGAVVAGHTRIGAHVCIGRGATVGHHTEIGAFTTLGPGVNLAGNCRIEEAVYIGIGATIVDHVAIGAHAVVGAGAVVVESAPERVLLVGVPARIAKRGIEGK